MLKAAECIGESEVPRVVTMWIIFFVECGALWSASYPRIHFVTHRFVFCRFPVYLCNTAWVAWSEALGFHFLVSWWLRLDFVSAEIPKVSKNLQPLQNCGRPKGDMQQVPYWGPRNIWRHRTKFSRPGDLASVILHSWFNVTAVVEEEEKVPRPYFSCWNNSRINPATSSSKSGQDIIF
jgi:hypothetical protein